MEADEELMRMLMNAALQEVLEAEMSERSSQRPGYRIGYYTRKLVTRVGTLELRVPQDRQGRFSTEIFERDHRTEKALVAALIEMYMQGGLDAEGEGDQRAALRT